MSAGAFEIGRYESVATGNIHPIRVQPETQTLSINGTANAYPAGTTDTPVSAQVSQSRRSLGVNARSVTIKFPTAAPTGYKVGSAITLPWFSPFPVPGFIRGQAVSYLGASGEFVGAQEEKVN